MKTFIKKNIRFIIIVVICITCSVLTTFATDYLFNSSEVYYNNTTSGIQADKVQGAIDELYACASNYAAYNQRLTSAETTIGSGSLTTTSQNLIGAVNGLNDQIGNIGSYVEGTVSQSLSVPSGTFTRLATMSLTKGTWVITGGFQFGSDFADYYVCQFRIGSVYTPGTKQRANASAGGGSNISWIIKNESNSLAVDLMAYQGSGSAKTADGVALRAVRIA